MALIVATFSHAYTGVEVGGAGESILNDVVLLKNSRVELLIPPTEDSFRRTQARYLFGSRRTPKPPRELILHDVLV